MNCPAWKNSKSSLRIPWARICSRNHHLNLLSKLPPNRQPNRRKVLIRKRMPPPMVSLNNEKPDILAGIAGATCDYLSQSGILIL